MGEVIDMQKMRYINIFFKVTRISTKKVFLYNNNIIYGVPKGLVSNAIGKGAENVKKINLILRKKIKIVAMPEGESPEDVAEFIKKLVEPVEINKIEVKDDKVAIGANKQSKASLIGRNRSRQKELELILKNTFGIVSIKFV